jgi:hypothetical protein
VIAPVPAIASHPSLPYITPPTYVVSPPRLGRCIYVPQIRALASPRPSTLFMIHAQYHHHHYHDPPSPPCPTLIPHPIHFISPNPPPFKPLPSECTKSYQLSCPPLSTFKPNLPYTHFHHNAMSFNLATQVYKTTDPSSFPNSLHTIIVVSSTKCFINNIEGVPPN